MKVKVYVQDLKPGMYVSEIDRPWLDTPFMFQGFLLTDIHQINQVRKYCEYVYIDPEKQNLTGEEDELQIFDQSAKQDIDKRETVRSGLIREFIPKPRKYENEVHLEEEIPAATRVRDKTQQFVNQIIDDVRMGRSLDISDAKQIVNNMVDSIIRNPNAQMCFTQLKERDEYTAQHSVNVCVLTITFGRHLGLNHSALNILGLGALLHDIGKLKIPLEILNKPGRLTEEEFIEMKKHPEYGQKILKEIHGLNQEVHDIVISHHERLAGHGYPNGLQGDDISFYSRIVAIVDVYDAITSDRCYHDGMKPTEALTKMYEWKATDFDIELLEQFIQCIGIYPVGSMVELSNGEVGVVIALHPTMRLKPKIMMILDQNKNPYFPTRIVNLSEFPADEENQYSIKSVLEPGTYNIQPKQYIHELQQAHMKQPA
jgi:putative nucleotidyltransferase with HDIG domain